MNVLCSDKTGTLTEGVVKLHSAIDLNGKENQKVLFYAYLNASFETGFSNPIDDAIRQQQSFDISGYEKLDEIPYDFVRKRLSILVKKDNTRLMVTKGALQNIIEICSMVEMADGNQQPIAGFQNRIQQQYQDLSAKGFRTLGITYRVMEGTHQIHKGLEQEMIFLGLLVFFDPPKPGIINVIENLKQLGIDFKIITGDNRLVSTSISHQVGLPQVEILTGSELRQMSDEALIRRVRLVNVFAVVEPNQKERIILALKKGGKVVGYIGDGINDASALHTADVGLSVDSAVDVAKEAADIVLLEKELDVLLEGVKEGRRTFANTLKYVFKATSANFSNMFSMAGASLFIILFNFHFA